MTPTDPHAAAAIDREADDWSGCPPDAEVLQRCRAVLTHDSARAWSIGALARRLEIAPRRIGRVLAAAGVDLPSEG